MIFTEVIVVGEADIMRTRVRLAPYITGGEVRLELLIIHRIAIAKLTAHPAFEFVAHNVLDYRMARLGPAIGPPFAQPVMRH